METGLELQTIITKNINFSDTSQIGHFTFERLATNYEKINVIVRWLVHENYKVCS